MNVKSLFRCCVVISVGSIFPPGVRAQMVDDTGSKWRLEQAMREEARLISSGKRLTSHSGAPVGVDWDSLTPKPIDEQREKEIERILEKIRRLVVCPEPEIQ